MSAQYLIDTDTIVAVLRRRADHVRTRFEALEGRIVLSAVSLFELEFGVYYNPNPDQRRARLNMVLPLFVIANFDLAAADAAARIRADLARLGTPIGPYDTLLAGHAMSLKATLVTNNTKEFQRINGLKVENWLAPS